MPFSFFQCDGCSVCPTAESETQVTVQNMESRDAEDVALGDFADMSALPENPVMESALPENPECALPENPEWEPPEGMPGNPVSDIMIPPPGTPFLVEVQKTPEAEFGIDVDAQDGQNLTVLGIKDTGILGKWNSKHPEIFCVRRGDLIIEVNGVKGKSQDLLKAIFKVKNTNGKLNLLVLKNQEAGPGK
mmetsp:Transcript_8539/g.15988  ORF Transcript_8539/g.15988 Transcript_8539/m.15988 type:complete len:190 (-) Transcript_8539:157-726(-)